MTRVQCKCRFVIEPENCSGGHRLANRSRYSPTTVHGLTGQCPQSLVRLTNSSFMQCKLHGYQGNGFELLVVGGTGGVGLVAWATVSTTGGKPAGRSGKRQVVKLATVSSQYILPLDQPGISHPAGSMEIATARYCSVSKSSGCSCRRCTSSTEPVACCWAHHRGCGGHSRS